MLKILYFALTYFPVFQGVADRKIFKHTFKNKKLHF